MKIFISGGTGFVGSNLADFFLKKGYRVTATGGRPESKVSSRENFRYIRADTTRGGEWQEAVNGADAVVNLAGRTIFNYWTRGYKQKISDSRVLTTRNIVEALPEKSETILCSASAAGYYGDGGDSVLTEDSPNGVDFLADVCRRWENEAFRAEEKGARVVAMRFGVVLGKDGGAMEKMVPAFRFLLGGRLGNGRQWFPWIHIDDLASGILFALENNDVRGPVNFTAPVPTRNADLAKTLGRALKRPAIMPAPKMIIGLVLGEFGKSILAGQRAVPKKLEKLDFQFEYPDIESAISDIV